MPTGIDATKIADGSVSSTEFQYINTLSSNAQTQIDGKANTSLNNLASVAINTTLVSDTDNTDDLGSATVAWANTYTRTVKIPGIYLGTVTITSPILFSDYTLTLPEYAGPAGYVLSTNGSGTLSWITVGVTSGYF